MAKSEWEISFMTVEVFQNNLTHSLSYLYMVERHFIKAAFHQSGISSKRHFIKAAFHQSGFSSNGFFIELEAFHQRHNCF
jgi:hypothetical protein